MTRNEIALVPGADEGVRLDAGLSLLRRSKAAVNLLTVQYADAFRTDPGLAHVEEAGQPSGFLDDAGRVARVRG